MVKIFTDGSCINNPGKGGWAYIILKNDKISYIGTGSDINTTNNRMELYAIIKSLEFTKNNNVTIYTDSKLIMNCCKNIWKRKSNLDLWEEYDKVSRNKNVDFVWVKGHSGNKFNECVDKLAFKESSKI